jgi:hypothetical protein
MKLIMTDEFGMQTGIYGAFGCGCEDHETKIGIKYNPTDQSISFYKNGFLQGTAFKGVPEGYFASLDLWFDSGTIEILPLKKPKMKNFCNMEI